MGFCVPWDPPTWVFTLLRASIPLYTPSLLCLPPSCNFLSLLLHIFLCHLPHHLCVHCTENRSIHLHLTSHSGEPCDQPNTTLPPSLSHNLSNHISNDGGEAGVLRRGNHQRHLPLLTADSPLPFAFWEIETDFGCSFNSGDKFPRFPARAMIFRLILRYHWPPNGPEERRTVAACVIVVDGAWSTDVSTGRMTA
ncbi:hypothetical protein D8674_022605 [Pyrus ussuriensis x Pyrus communis]|uniref:Uncharacterized protein n=1 Tax=Pyrus ussuriensis x Pyrus communis TaxID=2448454 RepID=A0A5N5GLJ2_9ROSA|nr:hypothetical protein D8674_022605 [Pyrus ussuriensis x Pyrus communis]